MLLFPDLGRKGGGGGGVGEEKNVCPAELNKFQR